MKQNDYNFGENTEEYSPKQRKKIPVWVSPKYTQTREAAIQIIEKYESLKDSDFWILMNETKSGKMGYTGLIISHNGCLKINDELAADMKFKPEYLELDKEGYGGSLVFSYNCPEQGLYEVGEVSQGNCRNSYPYAMAYKRLFDRVVLKNSRLAYAGVYSDSEADEFKEPDKSPDDACDGNEKITSTKAKNIDELVTTTGSDRKAFLEYFKVSDTKELTVMQYAEAVKMLSKKSKKGTIEA